MILKFLNLILIVLFLLHASFITNASYLLPKPLIRVFRPRGFEVSIPHVIGMQKLTFSANVNAPLRNEMDPRKIEYSKSVFEADPAGRMTVQDRVARIRLGDKFYYRLMVTKDDEDYFLTEQVFIVRAKDIFRQPPQCDREEEDEWSTEDSIPILVAGNVIDLHIVLQVILEPGYKRTEPSPTSSIPSPTTTETVPDTSINLDGCNAEVYSLVQKISSLQAEVAKLDKDHKILHSIVNKLSFGKNFKLSGKISKSDDPMSVVKFVLNEKLGITPVVTNVVRKDNSILFTVNNIDTTLQILKKVEEILPQSKSIQIASYRGE